jgi:hypothetical protein
VGRRNAWSVLEADATEDLEGVCHFGGGVFVCSGSAIYRLADDQLVAETRFADGAQPRTCMNLLPATGALFMQGEKDVFRFTENEWHRQFSIGPGST